MTCIIHYNQSGIIPYLISCPPFYFTCWNSKHIDRFHIFYVWGWRWDWTPCSCLEALRVCVLIINIIAVPEHSLYSNTSHPICPVTLLYGLTGSSHSMSTVLYKFGRHNQAAGHNPSTVSSFFYPPEEKPLFSFSPKLSRVHLQNPKASRSEDPEGKGMSRI